MVIVYSVDNGESLSQAEEILQYLWRSNSMAEKAVIVVGNKTDLVRTRVVNIVGKQPKIYIYIYTGCAITGVKLILRNRIIPASKLTKSGKKN